MRWAVWSPTCARTSSTRSTCRSMRRHGRGARHPRRPAPARHRHQRRGAERDRRDHRAARRRHAVPRPDAPERGAPGADVSREAIQALFEAAYDARFQVRLPEIKAVLVNLVTVRDRAATGVSYRLADRAAGRTQRPQRTPLIGERQMFADGRWQTAQVLRPRKAAHRRALRPGRRSWSRSTPPPSSSPAPAATVDAIGNLRIDVGSGP